MPPPMQENANEAAKVFVSYSRADTAFAMDLVAGLMACGFRAYIDQEDIAPGEPWEQRLGGLIADADTVVYVISPDSMASEHCAWEVRETLRLSKRLLPVVWRPVPDTDVPRDLARLNFVFFDPPRSFAQGLAELADALRTDVAWVREHSRLGALARRWEARNRPDVSLLRGEDLDAARDWSAGQPATGPPLTDSHRDFISASLKARETAEIAARNRRRGLVFATSAIALVMTGLAAVAAWQWQEADEATAFARAAFNELEVTNDQLQSAFIRLNADIGLRAPPTGEDYLRLPAGWFPLAANRSGSVVRVERRRADDSLYQVTSGLLIDGALAHPRYAGQPLLLAPNITTAFDESSGTPFMLPPVASLDEGMVEDPATPALTRALPAPPPPADEEAGIMVSAGPFEVPGDAPMMAQTRIDLGPPEPEGGTVSVVFPALSAGDTIAAADLIWETPGYLMTAPFQLWSLAGPPPFGALSVDAAAVSCDGFETLAWDGVITLEPGRAIALYGIGNEVDRGEDAITLFVSTLTDTERPRELLYEHSTTLGSAGAPVFDLETGQVFAVHIGSFPGADGAGRRTGFGMALPLILDEIRMDLETGEEPEPLEPTCGWGDE